MKDNKPPLGVFFGLDGRSAGDPAFRNQRALQAADGSSPAAHGTDRVFPVSRLPAALGGLVGAAEFPLPLSASPASGETELLTLGRRGLTIYVERTEALISQGLALAAFLVPGAYLAWNTIRRHANR